MFASKVSLRLRSTDTSGFLCTTHNTNAWKVLSLAAVIASATAAVVFDDNCSGTDTTLVTNTCVEFPSAISSFSYTGGNAELEAIIYQGAGCSGKGSTVHLDDNNDCTDVDAFFPTEGVDTVSSVCLLPADGGSICP